MSLEAIDIEAVADDVVNLVNVSAVSNVMLEQELKIWQDMRATSHIANANSSLAAHYVGLLRECTQAYEALPGALLAGVDTKKAVYILQGVSACIASARLKRAFRCIDVNISDFEDGPQSEDGTIKIIENEGPAGNRLIYGALGIIVAEETMANCLFGGLSGMLPSAEKWYWDDETEIYVHALTPAVPTRYLMDQLTLAEGSTRAAEKFVDAAHSVELRPYLSAEDIFRKWFPAPE